MDYYYLWPQGERMGLSNGIGSVFFPIKTRPRMLILYLWINVCKICWNHRMEGGNAGVTIYNVSVVPLCSSFPMLRAVGTSSKEEKSIFIIWVLVCRGGNKRQTYQYKAFLQALKGKSLLFRHNELSWEYDPQQGTTLRDSTWQMCSAMSALVALSVQKKVSLPLK